MTEEEQIEMDVEDAEATLRFILDDLSVNQRQTTSHCRSTEWELLKWILKQ